MRRFREWLADHFRGFQYPKQQFIPHQQSLGAQLSTEQRLFYGVIGMLGVIIAMTLLGIGVFIVGVWLFG